MLDALQFAKIDRENCWVVDVRLPDGSLRPLGATAPDEVFAAFSDIAPLAIAMEEASLWQKFASPSPLDFDHARRTHPEIREVCEPYGMFFPQVGPRSALRLSQLDQRLFSTLRNREWLRPIDLLKRNRRLIEDLMFLGDVPLVQRLRAWAKNGQNPVFEMREERGDSQFTAVSFRLTDIGERIRDHGLESLKEAAPMFIGGCHTYAEPWVRRNRGRSWWIEQLD
jgi:hypothetical protein